MTPEESRWVGFGVTILLAIGGAIGTLWMRISTVSTRHTDLLSAVRKDHDDKLSTAMKDLAQKISENTRELHTKVDSRVRQEDLDRQLEPVKKSIDLLREESQRREEQSEIRHGERAREHQELIRKLDSMTAEKKT